MPVDYVKQAIGPRALERAEMKSGRVPNAAQPLQDDLRHVANAINSTASRLDREVLVALRALRDRWNAFIRELATGSILQGKLGPRIMWGTGVPVADPIDADGNGARAIYIDMAGGAGATFYVWEGAAWAPK